MKKRTLYLSLIEMIVVIILITTISTTLSINVYKYLQTGKAFKTQQNIQHLTAALEMQWQQGASFSFSESTQDGYERVDNWKELSKESLFFPSKNSNLKDAWGNEFEVSYSKETEEFLIYSREYQKYIDKYGPLNLNDSHE